MDLCILSSHLIGISIEVNLRCFSLLREVFIIIYKRTLSPVDKIEKCEVEYYENFLVKCYDKVLHIFNKEA